MVPGSPMEAAGGEVGTLPEVPTPCRRAHECLGWGGWHKESWGIPVHALPHPNNLAPDTPQGDAEGNSGSPHQALGHSPHPISFLCTSSLVV